MYITTCTVHHMYAICTPHVHHMYVHPMNTTCTPHVHTPHVHTTHEHHMYTTCTPLKNTDRHTYRHTDPPTKRVLEEHLLLKILCLEITQFSQVDGKYTLYNVSQEIDFSSRNRLYLEKIDISSRTLEGCRTP